MDWNNTLLIVTADHSNSYMRNQVKLSAGDLPRQVPGGSWPPGYGGPACTYPDGEVTYGSTGHTNELVRLYAVGAGITKFDKYEGRWYPGTTHPGQHPALPRDDGGGRLTDAFPAQFEIETCN